MAFSWPNKDPNEILDFDINWTKRLYSHDELAQYTAAIKADPTLKTADPSTVVMPTDSIIESTFTLPTGSLQAQSSTYTTRVTKVWLTGGDEATSYEVLNRVKTFGGRTMDQTVKLKVKSK